MKENIKILKGILIFTLIIMIMTFIPKDVLAADTIYTSNLAVGNNMKFNGSSWYLYSKKASTLATSTKLGAISNGAKFRITSKSGNWLAVDITEGSYSNYTGAIYLYYGSTAASYFSKINTTPKPPTPKTVEVTNIALKSTRLDLKIGQTKTLTKVILPTNAKNKTVTWKSNNTQVATVNSNGLVKAVGAGTTTITVKSNNGLTDTCTVTVTNPAPKTIAVTNIAIKPAKLELKLGETKTLTKIIVPTNATNQTVTWSSSNNEIAEVNTQGQITPKKIGTVTITVKSNNGKTAKCRVDVKLPASEQIPATGIGLDTTKLNLVIGTSAKLEATVYPFGVSNRTVTWSSSNNGIATVSAQGEVRTVKIGTATITAKTYNNKKVTCTVKVLPVPVSKVELDTTNIALIPGKTAALKATVSPTNATNKAVTWSSSNPSVAKVTNGSIQALKIGKTTITVTSNADKKIKATCMVNIQKELTKQPGDLDKGYMGIVTSSSGRKYIEWQTKCGPWVNEEYAGGTYYKYGCPVASAATYIGAYGVSINPGTLLKNDNYDIYNIGVGPVIDIFLKSRYGSTIKVTNNGNNLSSNQKEDIIAKLKTGIPIMIYVQGGYYTDSQHYMVIADYRSSDNKVYLINSAAVAYSNPSSYSGWVSTDQLFSNATRYYYTVKANSI